MKLFFKPHHSEEEFEEKEDGWIVAESMPVRIDVDATGMEQKVKS